MIVIVNRDRDRIVRVMVTFIVAAAGIPTVIVMGAGVRAGVGVWSLSRSRI